MVAALVSDNAWPSAMADTCLKTGHYPCSYTSHVCKFLTRCSCTAVCRLQAELHPTEQSTVPLPCCLTSLSVALLWGTVKQSARSYSTLPLAQALGPSCKISPCSCAMYLIFPSTME